MARGNIPILWATVLVAMVGDEAYADEQLEGDEGRRVVMSSADKDSAIREARKIESRFEAQNPGRDLELEVREWEGTFEVSVPNSAQVQAKAPDARDQELAEMRQRLAALEGRGSTVTNSTDGGGSSSSTTRKSRPRKRATAAR